MKIFESYFLKDIGKIQLVDTENEPRASTKTLDQAHIMIFLGRCNFCKVISSSPQVGTEFNEPSFSSAIGASSPCLFSLSILARKAD